MLRRLVTTLAGLALILSLAGCFETVQTIHLNPDGSGKLSVVSLAPPAPQFGDAGKAPPRDPKQVALEALRNFLGECHGIEAWSDVSAEVTPEGKTQIKATAWFPDISKVKVQMELRPTWQKDATGMRLTLMNKEEPTTRRAPRAISDAELKKEIQRRKTEYQQSRPMVAGIFSSLRMDATYILPGTVDSSNVFTRVDNGIRFTIEGKRLLEAMDKLNSDDALIEKDIRSGGDKDEQSDAIAEIMLGGKGPVTAHVGGALKPHFDYQAEVAKAKAAEPAMFKALGLTWPLPPRRGRDD